MNRHLPTEPLRSHIERTGHIAGPSGCTQCNWQGPVKNTSRQLCPHHPDADYRHAWGCPQCLAELRDALRKAWGILYAAVDDSPVIQKDLRPGDWQRLKYGALEAMHMLEEAMGGQSMSRKGN